MTYGEKMLKYSPYKMMKHLELSFDWKKISKSMAKLTQIYLYALAKIAAIQITIPSIGDDRKILQRSFSVKIWAHISPKLIFGYR